MPQYTQSQAYTDALEALRQHQSTKPGEYESPFADRLNALYEQVMGRGDFEYDFNADALYQQHRDRYMQDGRRAMQDTMANATALTGGYGNSYAQTAGQQAYGQYMTGLNDVVPELEQRAYERWRAENDDVLQQLALIRDMDAEEYGRHQDRVNEYYTMLDYLTGEAGAQYDRDYQQHQDALDMFLANRDYYYGKAQNEAAKKSSGSGGSSGKKNSGGSNTNTEAKVADNTEKESSGYDINSLVSAIKTIAQKEGPKAALAEYERMVETYDLLPAMQNMLRKTITIVTGV